MDNSILDHETNEASLMPLVYAGRGARLAAHITDSVICAVTSSIAMYLYKPEISLYLLYLLITLLLLVYKPFFEYRYGATPGKMAMKLKVLRTDLSRISLMQAIVRDAVFMVSILLEILKTSLGLFAPVFTYSYGHYLTDGLGRYDWYTLFLIAFMIVDTFVWLGDGKGRSLHDHMAGTVVVVRPE